MFFFFLLSTVYLTQLTTFHQWLESAEDVWVCGCGCVGVGVWVGVGVERDRTRVRESEKDQK
jgi:hypothetical protein